MGDSDITLGEAIFGTTRGLFAYGTGILAGVENSSQIFEIRDKVRKYDLVPDEGKYVIIRRAVTANQTLIDLIMIAKSIVDLEKRRGFLGCAVAVEYGRVENYLDAFESVVEKFKGVQEYYLDGNRIKNLKKIDIGSVSKKAWHNSRYYKAGGDVEPIVLISNWRDKEQDVGFVFDGIIAAARWSGKAASTIAVVEDSRFAGHLITSELIDRFEQEVRRREEEERVQQDRMAEQKLLLLENKTTSSAKTGFHGDVLEREWGGGEKLRVQEKCSTIDDVDETFPQSISAGNAQEVRESICRLEAKIDFLLEWVAANESPSLGNERYNVESKQEKANEEKAREKSKENDERYRPNIEECLMIGLFVLFIVAVAFFVIIYV